MGWESQAYRVLSEYSTACQVTMAHVANAPFTRSCSGISASAGASLFSIHNFTAAVVCSSDVAAA